MDKPSSKMRKTVSVKTQGIIVWSVFILFAALMGVIGYFSSHTYTKDDFQEISISFARIKTNRDSESGDSYIIYSIGDENSFSINNIVSSLFDKPNFDGKVVSGDKIVLTVLKSDYDNNDALITTLGVKKNDTVFLDFERALKTDNNNAFACYVMFLIAMPLAGILLIAFIIWLILYNRGVIGQNKAFTSDKRMESNYCLSATITANKREIKFPCPASTIVFYIIGITLGIVISFVSAVFMLKTNLGAFICAIIISVMLVVLNAISMVARFRRKLIIDNETRTLTYISLFKKTFSADDILSMENLVSNDSEGESVHFLRIKTTSKKIDIRTQSDAQSVQLREDIQFFMLSTELESDN